MIILFVEDNLSLAMLTARNIKIERSSWRMLAPGSCFEARNVTDHIVPDVALIDLELPDGNGLDLLLELHLKFDDLPIFIISGSASEKIHREV
ncbi:response regulator, partial [candidate division KSB3 bacterium]|nr:response regulator [candidate division KSB3 bacterium]